jgi:hypothetical protein
MHRSSSRLKSATAASIAEALHNGKRRVAAIRCYSGLPTGLDGMCPKRPSCPRGFHWSPVEVGCVRN